MVPVGKAAPEFLIYDNQGLPLVIEGTTVAMSLSPCAPGTCRVDSLHPAPPGNRWYQFESQLLGDSGPDGSADLTLDFRFSNPADCQAWSRVTVETWFTDDRDQRYGSIVHEAYAAYVVTPLLSPWGLGAFAFALCGAGVWWVRRTRRALAA